MKNYFFTVYFFILSAICFGQENSDLNSSPDTTTALKLKTRNLDVSIADMNDAAQILKVDSAVMFRNRNVQTAFQQKNEQIQYYYNKRLVEKPKLKGVFKESIYILPNGSVDKCEINESCSLHDKILEEKIVALVNKLKFEECLYQK